MQIPACLNLAQLYKCNHTHISDYTLLIIELDQDNSVTRPNTPLNDPHMQYPVL